MLRHLRLLVLLLGLLQLNAAAVEPVTADENELSTQEEVEEAKAEFETIDTNNDGFISREEILEMEEVPESEEIDEFFSTYDSNEDGRVTFEEILAADEALREEAKDKEL